MNFPIALPFVAGVGITLMLLSRKKIVKSKKLTFGDIIYREAGSDNSGLPKDAVKCSFPELDKALLGFHQKALALYKRYGLYPVQYLKIQEDSRHAGNLVEERESGFDNESFGCKPHPVVEGYEWQKGYEFKYQGGSLFILSGWLKPDCKGGAPLPIVYKTGVTFDDETEVLRVVENFYARGYENAKAAVLRRPFLSRPSEVDV